MNEKKWSKSLNIYTMLVKTDTVNGYFYEQLANCYSHLNEPEEAVRCYITAIKINPENQKNIIDLTYCYYLLNQNKNALSILNAGLKYHPFSSELWKWKGDIYIKMSDYDSALFSYYRAFYAGDTTANMLKNIGICLYWSKDYIPAEVFLKRSIEVSPIDYSGYFYLGASFKAQNKLDKALENFKKADSLLQNDALADIYVQIGSVYQTQKKYNSALEYYKDAIRENPSNRATYFYLAAMYDKLNNKNVAAGYYKLFLKDSNNQDKTLVDYSKHRIIDMGK